MRYKRTTTEPIKVVCVYDPEIVPDSASRGTDWFRVIPVAEQDAWEEVKR